jgi:hypothetical protein
MSDHSSFQFRRARTRDRSTTDATVAGGEFKEVEAQVSTFFQSKHRVFPDFWNILWRSHEQ